MFKVGEEYQGKADGDAMQVSLTFAGSSKGHACMHCAAIFKLSAHTTIYDVTLDRSERENVCNNKKKR